MFFNQENLITQLAIHILKLMVIIDDGDDKFTIL